MKVTILSPEKTVFEGDVNSILLPGVSGSFTVWNHHAPLLSALEAGVIQTDDLVLLIDEGFAEVKNDRVNVLVEGAISLHDIDLYEEEEILEKLLKKSVSGDVAMDAHLKEIKKYQVRIHAKKNILH